MRTEDPAIQASFDACRQIVRQAHSNFPIAFRFLPTDQRRGMEALYAWLRIVDDIADEPGDATTKKSELHALRESLTRRDREGANAELAPSRLHLVMPALFETIDRYHIRYEHLLAVLDGVESDLNPQTFATFEDLLLYCYRVASAVGLACLAIWGVTDDRATEPATAAGIAFQLTNILRDLGEDRRNGRDYLPVEDSGKPIEFQIGRARVFYRQSDALVPLLPRPGRRMFLMMRSIYEALLDEIARRPDAVLTERLRVSRWKKAWLLLRAW